MLRPCPAFLAQGDEKLGDEQVPNIMRGERHRTQRTVVWVVLVPVVVKSLQRIGRSSLGQKHGCGVLYISEARPPVWVVLGTHLFKIVRQEHGNDGMVS